MKKDLLQKELEKSFKIIGKDLDISTRVRVTNAVRTYYNYVEKSGVDSFTKVSYIVKLYIEEVQNSNKIHGEQAMDHVCGVVFRMGLNLLETPVEYVGYPETYFKKDSSKITYEYPQFYKYFIRHEDPLDLWLKSFQYWVGNRASDHNVGVLADLYRDAYNFSVNNKHENINSMEKVLQKVREGVDRYEQV